MAIGPRSQLYPVSPGFKMIVVVEQTRAYSNLDLPLLSRFEKQIVCPQDVITEKQQDMVAYIEEWCTKVSEQTTLGSMDKVFCGYHPGYIASLVHITREKKQ
jgi:hypothetical protein